MCVRVFVARRLLPCRMDRGGTVSREGVGPGRGGWGGGGTRGPAGEARGA